MTIDERLEFLVQSTESLHATVMEQTSQIEKHTEQLKIDAANIRRLDENATRRSEFLMSVLERITRIMDAHQQRLDALEGGKNG